ncbi:MAG: trigger factor [Catonella sp.]|jgi:trigger factor|nr:trigger factor [Catonella sp.]MDY6357511.1 trigger factor [Catonella sp.]
MSVNVEKLEHNMVKLTIESDAKDLDAAIVKAYNKAKNRIAIPGFRKGKAPLNMIEKMYGEGVFYEDAANELIPTAYDNAVKEEKLEIVSDPKFDVTQIEKGKNFIFTAEVAVKPAVELGEYKGVKVAKPDTSVSEDEINEEIENDREKNARTIEITDDVAKEDDRVDIDFDGYVDGKQFKGGKSEGYTLTLGSGTFIDNFEEQIAGHKKGDAFDVNVTFPEKYHESSLAGKPAVFKVVLNKVERKELPEVDDDFAEDVSGKATVDEYKEDVKQRLADRKTKAAKEAKEDEAIDKAVENAKMDIPDAMIDTQVKQLYQEFANRLQAQGMTPQQYFQFTGLDPKGFIDNLKPEALKRIQARLVLEAVADAENIQVNEEDFENHVAEMAKDYNLEVEKLKSMIGENEKEAMYKDIAVQKAVDIVADNAVEVEEAHKPEKKHKKVEAKEEKAEQ